VCIWFSGVPVLLSDLSTALVKALGPQMYTSEFEMFGTIEDNLS
jgi:hypothetical protein